LYGKHCNTSRFLIIAAVVWLGAISTPLHAYEARVEEIINNPTVYYQKAFTVDANPEIWNRVLDNLYVMGRLWRVYRFPPAYQVTQTDLGLHVIDPTGIIGDVRQVGQTDYSRCFYGHGQFNHWALPSFFNADGVILFEWTMEQNRLVGEVKISMRGNNWISRAAMRLISGTLKYYIDNRFMHNLEDTKKIIRDIAVEPDNVRKGLTGSLRDDFDRAFPPNGTQTDSEANQ